MAGEDAEIALLRQMQAGQDSVAWEGDGANGVAEGEQPSNTEHNNQEVKKEAIADDQVLRALSPSGAGADSDGEYDPSSVTSIPAVAIAGDEGSRSSSRASVRKRKTVGGFIADDSDEDTDASTPGQTSTNLLQPPSSNLPKRAPSPLQTSVSQQDLQGTPENQGDSMAAPNSSHVLSVNPSSAGLPSVQASAAQVLTSAGTSAQAVAVPKARLPNDRTGILEDRIKEDPRGELDSWLALINEYRSRNKLDEARAAYERFFKVFPQAAEVWVAYAEMELENDNRSAAEQIFGKSLMTVPNVQLWSVYLNYIRRVNDLTNDVTGTARQTISQSYDFVLDNIGSDRDSGKIWTEYIQFVRSAPGQVGGTSWQDQQKMDQLRKAYQRAICVPMSTVNNLWKEYDQFEMSLNKMTGRKFLQEKSPGYMSARSANTAMENITRGLIRTTLPRLPPAHGFDGEQEYNQQVDVWKRWLSWEQEDPLVLKTEEPKAYNARVLYLHKQAVMALRFWPETWVDAAEWCFSNGLDAEGDTFLNDGIAANPESCLLAFKKADRLETTLTAEEAGKGPAEQGAVVRAPYDKLLDTLYESIKQLKVREAADLAKLDESIALDASISAIVSKAEDDDEENEAEKKVREADKENKTRVIRLGYSSQAQLISRTISFAWIALMRAMRRIQGKGAVKDKVGGSRQIFADARARGKLTSDVYVASALIEHHVYKDPAGTKIFERGAKLFPEDDVFILEYLKHLLSIGDTTNARVAFETAVSRLTQKPESVAKAKPLYAYFHKYESKYGELSQIRKLELRMAELYPEDPKLLQFASRYSGQGFDPTAVRPIISPATQMRPKSTALMPSIEQHTSVQDSPRPQFVQEISPRPQYLQTTNSPKRPFPVEDMDDDRPRKLARGQSPLKGAAGRRLNQQKQLHGTPGWQSNAPPFVVPRDITFLLSIIPRADLYQSTKFNSEALVQLLGQTYVPEYGAWKASREQPQPQQQQRYDGRTSSTRPQSHDQGGSYSAFAGQDDRQIPDSHYIPPPASVPSYGGGGGASYGPPAGYGNAPSYGGGAPGPGYPHAAPGPSGGAWSGAYQQPVVPQPQPDSSRSGYYGTAPGTENRNWQQPQAGAQGPSLSTADSWYYPQPQANTFAPGYPPYGR
ncbi:mRNA 3'-end-processing protein rna14 [Lachnellula suecica]|uniref:mRNA 3'-end-processing protein RNA14 n=1 Tax=Lachnellula suecica TaxID=602035 RepID=A0A8T9C4N5_9HELO|nr:mRNA 3'-end-processing protein rna14 [Lachnellula suecica]